MLNKNRIFRLCVFVYSVFFFYSFHFPNRLSIEAESLWAYTIWRMPFASILLLSLPSRRYYISPHHIHIHIHIYIQHTRWRALIHNHWSRSHIHINVLIRWKWNWFWTTQKLYVHVCIQRHPKHSHNTHAKVIRVYFSKPKQSNQRGCSPNEFSMNG